MHLSKLTTLRLGGEIAEFIRADTEADFCEHIRRVDEAHQPLLVLGGGSNIVPLDTPFTGTVVQDQRTDITVIDSSPCAGTSVRATAGVNFDDLVVFTLDHGLSGLEALSGIPGSVGAAPVQNIGAYGGEISEVLASARVFDRISGKIQTFTASEFGFSYRDSILKQSQYLGKYPLLSPRWIVLEVLFQLPNNDLSAPVRYQQLANFLGVRLGARVPTTKLREAVLALRGSKGMVLDDADHDTWSAGSFFTNPVIPESLLPEGAPIFPVQSGAPATSGAASPTPGAQSETGEQNLVKTSAAWLIGRAGCPPGFGLNEDVRLSTKHTLAITNRGAGTGAQVRELATEVARRVRETFNIDLVPEPLVMQEPLEQYVFGANHGS